MLKTFNRTLFFALAFFILSSVVQANPYDALKKLLSLVRAKPQPKQFIGLMSIEHELDSAKSIVKKFMSITRNSQIQGLIVHINCLGGHVGTSQAIFSELKKLKKKMPVVVIVENFCVSGAYYVACAADCIIASPSAEIGNIGALYKVSKYKNMKFNKNNTSGDLDIFVYTAGDFKTFGNPHTPLKEEETEFYKQKIAIMYKQFVSDVAQARKLSVEDAQLWANGKIFVATEALELGLIDALGDFSDAIAKMKELLAARGNKNVNALELMDL